MITSHSDFAEHHLKIKKMLSQYWKARLSQDLESANDISLRILDEATLLRLVTRQSLLVDMANQKN
jgi:hypothetical protein